MNVQEKTLNCQDCHKPFSFGVREQQSHQQKGYTSAPKRCPQCRRTRRDGREQANGSIPVNGNVQTNGRGQTNGNVQTNGRVDNNGRAQTSGRVDNNGRMQSSTRNQDGRAPRNNDAVPCALCGAPTRVPVQPGSGRHVYCSLCYTKQPAYSRKY